MRPDSPVWQLPSVNAALDLEAALGHIEGSGGMPAEPPPVRSTMPRDIYTDFTEKSAPDWLLPVLLKPAGKLALDLVSDWPWIAPQHLRMLMGVSQGRLSQVLLPLADAGLVERVSRQGQRLAPTDRGLALLARRDRASVGVARNGGAPLPAIPASRLTGATSPADAAGSCSGTSSIPPRPRVHGRPCRAGPLPGLGDRANGPAPPGVQVLSVRRPAAGDSPLRLRRPAAGRRHLELPPGMGTQGGSTHHDDGPSRPLPPLLFDPQAH